jgi:hypothetical protein
MTHLQYLIQLNEVCQFQSREGGKIGIVSNSELRRWINNGVLSINGIKVTENKNIVFPIKSVTLFTKLKIITLL